MLLKNKILKNIFVVFAIASFIAMSTLTAFTLSKNYKIKRVAVPDFSTSTLAEAKEIAKEAHLKIFPLFVPSASPKDAVISQVPSSGSMVKKGDIVELIVSSGITNKKTRASTIELKRKIVTKKEIDLNQMENDITSSLNISTSSLGSTLAKKGTRGKICIDPGHQLRGDSSGEPIGPGSSILKPKVTQGAVGAVTKKPEHELVLEMSLKLKQVLENKGFEVLLTREAADANISNSQRAKMASDWNANFFIRLHADSNSNSSVKGISTLYPAKNQWTESFYQKSYEWAKEVHKAVIAATGRTDRGVSPRSELSGFNWSKVPVILIEMGFLSNPEEDRLLNSNSEQQKIIDAIVNVIDSRFPTN